MNTTDLRITFWGTLIMGTLANMAGDYIFATIFLVGAVITLITLIYETLKK